MNWTGLLAILFLACSATLGQAGPSTESVHEKPAHDREFWRAIAKNHYALPEGQPAFLLLRELSGYLGSRDPELRDDLAYTITAVWIKHHQQFSTNELNSLLDEWGANLRVGVGESGPNGVLKRSFSALCLAALAERDLKTPFLTEERYQTLLEEALAYLKDERDLRGFDPAIGWIHATAHTADLLTALAGNPFFRAQDERRVLDAIGDGSRLHIRYSLMGNRIGWRWLRQQLHGGRTLIPVRSTVGSQHSMQTSESGKTLRRTWSCCKLSRTIPTCSGDSRCTCAAVRRVPPLPTCIMT